MDHFRAIIRLFFFSLASVATVALTLAGNLLLRSEDQKYRWKNRVTHNFGRFVAWIMGMHIEVKGEPPEPPFFLVSNHLSYVDIIPFWSTLPCTFIAKNEIQGWPFFGFAAKSLGVLFIDRENSRDIPRVNALISSVINDEQGIVLFPEGTSTKGAEVVDFKPPLLHFPSVSGSPVSYASISYRTDDPEKPAHEYVCWWGGMSFFDHLYELLKIRSFKASVVFGDKTITSDDRKKLARSLHQEVKNNFRPVVDNA